MKRFLPYIAIFIILVGLFSPMINVNAQTVSPVDPKGTCSWTSTSRGGTASSSRPNVTQDECKSLGGAGAAWLENGKTVTVNANTAPQDGLGHNLPACIDLTNFNMGGCLVNLFYFLLVAIPSWLLILSGMFFDSIVAITLNSSTLAGSNFIPEAWGVVRDLSNIFFIIVLLFIAFQMILDIGGHDAKKMIVKVIIMALLINFSMFFTKVVIDSSNVLALVFYNKLTITTTKNKEPEKYIPITNVPGEKNISTAIASAFNPSKLLSQDFFKQAKERTVVGMPGPGTYLIGTVIPFYSISQWVGYFIPQYEVPIPLMLGIILVSGLIMLFATYTFFVAGFCFLSRLIELWILIIFSPFAFMSFTLPIFERIDYIGWDAWWKRLLAVSFMAPIFMFFLYFIFMLINANIFGNLARDVETKQTTAETVLFVIIPALTILILLLQATKFAKKASGALGETLMKMGSVGLALAGGVAIGTTAKLGQGLIGRYARTKADSKEWKENAAKGKFGAKTLLNTANYLGGASFDVRKGVTGTALSAFSTATGVNLGHQSKIWSETGGYDADVKRRDEKRRQRAEQLKVGKHEGLTQDLHHAEEEHLRVSLRNEEDIREKDRDIKGAEARVKRLKDVAIASEHMGKNADGSYKDPEYEDKQKEYAEAADKVKTLYDEKSAIKSGGFNDKTGEYRTHNGKISAGEVNKAKIAADSAKDEVKDAEALRVSTKNTVAVATAAVQAAPTAANIAALATAEKAAIDATQAYANAEKKAAVMTEKANRANTASLGGTGHSQNDYEDTIVPEAKHAINKENHERMGNFAHNLEANPFWGDAFFRRSQEVHDSAHEIRMGTKLTKSHGGGHDAGKEFAGDLAAEWIGAKVFHPDQPAAASHGSTSSHGGAKH